VEKNYDTISKIIVDLIKFYDIKVKVVFLLLYVFPFWSFI